MHAACLNPSKLLASELDSQHWLLVIQTLVIIILMYIPNVYYNFKVVNISIYKGKY